MRLLEEKVIFLTGGSKGIGLECAKKYVEEGARVLVVANDAPSIAESILALGERSTGILCDVSKPADVEEAIRQT
ncbi:MAG TPA: SDR family NAD(P)-dependent oxidoreductase, partial [Chitinophagaceae bacterium]